MPEKIMFRNYGTFCPDMKYIFVVYLLSSENPQRLLNSMFCCEKRKGGLACRGKKLPLNSVHSLLASGGTTRLRCDFGLGVLRVSPLHTQLFLGSPEKMTDQWKEEKVGAVRDLMKVGGAKRN